MSARKVPSGTPGTRGKASTKKNKPPTPKLPLNSTFMSRTSNNLQADMTFSMGGPSIAPKLTAPDWALQCDLAYSEYLRAIVTRHITHETILNYEEAVDDQLSRQAEFLRKAKAEQNRLVNEIKDIELQIQIDKLYSEFEQTFNEINEILRDYNMLENLDTYIASCQSACNKLDLQNIKPFERQEDYDKFSMLLEKCTETMKKLKQAIGNTEITEVLGQQIRKYVALQDAYIKKHKMVSDLQAHANLLIFKNASDKFARIHEYNV